MKSNALRPLLIASLLVGSLSCKSSSPPLLTTESPQGYYSARMARDVFFLASDELEGRGIGTKGLDRAADYIAARYQSLGLRPLPGQLDYFQPFTVTSAASVDPATTFKINDTALEVSEQYRPPGFSADGQFSAPVVFAGYGATDPEHHYDDFAGIDVKGKVVLVMRYEPHNPNGTSRFSDGDWSRVSWLNTKADVAAERGAVAVLLVNPPKFHDEDDSLVNRGGARTKIPFIHIKRTVADDLLKRGGSTKDLTTLQTEIDTAAAPQSFELKDVTVSGNIIIKRQKVTVKNVVGYLPGEGNADEYVVVGAHYDHLGTGGVSSRSRNKVEVHNGADDNASGTAALLDLADRIIRGGRRQRSIIFICFSAEEEGLLGSRHFVENPPIKLDKIVAMLNLDMVGRVRDGTIQVGGGGTAAAFDSILKSADDASPLKFKPMGKGGLGPSDHESFARKKIPVLFFFSGLHADYHRPTDDADKINYRAMDQVVVAAQQIVDALTSMPRQQYVATFDSQRSNLSGVGSRGSRVTLGVMPDYGSDESTTGVRITGTTPGSPAQAAGLLDGDVIVQMNDMKVSDIYGLMNFLSQGKPGQEVKLLVDRKGQRIELTATLAARKD